MSVSKLIARVRKKFRAAAIAMDSLDSVELIIAIEKTFDVDILDAELNTLTTPVLSAIG
jgi:acyl carrier protein